MRGDGFSASSGHILYPHALWRSGLFSCGPQSTCLWAGDQVCCGPHSLALCPSLCWCISRLVHPTHPAYSRSGFLVLQVTLLFAPSTSDPAEGQSPGQSSLPGATHGCRACRDTASSVFSAEFEATAAWPTLSQASPLQTLLECQTWQLLCLWKKFGETLS